MSKPGRTVPVDEFVQAIGSQLDRAQDALALKVSGGNRPLTWALKDLDIELRVFVEFDDRGRMLLRTAGPNEKEASSLHFTFTTITRPMVEENSYQYQHETDPRSLDDIRGGGEMDVETQRKLDLLGVRTVGQLKQLDPMAVQAVIGIPATKLQAALAASARPTVTGQEVIARPDGVRLLRIRGANLYTGVLPEVRLAGAPVEVVEAQPHTLVVRPLAVHDEGQIEVFTDGQRATGWFRIERPSGAGSATALASGAAP
ncbi:MAG: hypothetical protein ABI678_14575 [Kofleriaceae bacterium]